VTNLLTVNVEAYYTGSSPQANNKLNVAITQDEIWGPQTGASSFYPENIDPSTGLYKHSHMLRHLMTGQWGDPITNTTAGTLFSKTYTYTLPAIIGDVPMDISKLNIVAFVTETNEKIISAGDGKPVLTNLPNNLEAEMISLTAPDYTCDGVVEPSFNVRNYGAQDITSMRIGYSVNGGSQYIYNWTGGPILPGYNLDITMPLVGFPVAASNELDVTIEKVNGDTDDVPGNNSAMVAISGVEEHITTSVVVEVTPDDYAAEIGWKLYDANGSVIDSVATGTWANGDVTVQTKTLTLNTLDCYSLEIEDTYGDGLLAPGKIELKDGSGAVLYMLTGSYSMSEYKFATVDAAGNGNGNGDGSSVNPSGIRDLNNAFTFGLFPNPANDVLNVSFDDQVKEIKIINLLGEVVINANLKQIDVAELSSGVYFVTVTDSQGREVSQSFVKK
ncbi:Omp28-related outer membrane protein, partial [Chitinophagales bacterium]|nr:Omp28-related outer membrane protein [Chitinophagales bacterium]